MDKQERIYSAAIQFHIEQGRFSLVEVGLCLTYEDCALRRWINNQGLSEIDKEVNGFITKKNRFVDAKEAMKIAVECNQIEAIRKAFDAIPDIHDKEVDSHDYGEAVNLAIDLRDEYLAKELKPEDLY